MEMQTDYTCNPVYSATYSNLMGQKQAFMEIMNNPRKGSIVNLNGLEDVDISHLRKQLLGNVDVGHLRKHLGLLQQAFDIKISVVAYWKIVLMRPVDWVKDIIGMEKQTDYIRNPGYLATYSKRMGQQQAFMKIMNNPGKGFVVNLKGLGAVDVGYLKGHLGLVQQAFDMKMWIVAYWKIILMRLELMAPRSGGINRMLDESLVVAEKRSRLKKSVKLLKESKEVVSNIMDRISYHGDQERD
ncbi:hypothetical protein P3L10_034100 [Capsicum annuum]